MVLMIVSIAIMTYVYFTRDKLMTLNFMKLFGMKSKDFYDS